MSRFTPEEFDIAFGQVYPTGTYHLDNQCKTFLKTILTNNAKYVKKFISEIPKSDIPTRDQCLHAIIEHTDIVNLIGFIQTINDSSTTTDTISKHLSGYEDLPIAKVCLKMFRNRGYLFHVENLTGPHPVAASVEPGSAHGGSNILNGRGGSRPSSSSSPRPAAASDAIDAAPAPRPSRGGRGGPGPASSNSGADAAPAPRSAPGGGRGRGGL